MGTRDPCGVHEALSRRRRQGTFRQLSKRPTGSTDFSSNDFLSLASNKELRRDYMHALQNHPAEEVLGSGGSRLLDGNSTYAEEVEKELAAFYHAPSGLLFNSGFDANVSIFSCLPQPNDIVIFDELIHASVHDGMRLSRAASCLSFKHNDVAALEGILAQLMEQNDKVNRGESNVFVAIETVYSMSGDVAPLANIAHILKKTLACGNGHLIVDEAHAVGVFGSKGRGLVSLLGLEDQVSVRLHTFGKAIACSGAVVLCSSAIREYLINYARPLIYTTFMPFTLLIAIRVSHEYLQRGKAESSVRHLQHLRGELHNGLLATSASLPDSCSHLVRIPDTPPQSAITYVMSTQALDLADYCRSHGLWVRAILQPTVPAGTERVRICLHSGNTIEEVKKLIAVIQSWACRVYQAKL